MDEVLALPPKWKGPYVFYEVYTNDTYKLVDVESFQLDLINSKFLKHYFP